MLRVMPPTVKAVLLAMLVPLCLGSAGCYWYRYGDLMRTHCELLAAMAQKLCPRGASAPLPGSALGGYEYPLARARDFVRVAAKRCPTRRSLRAFQRVLRVYDGIVHGAARGVGRGCGRRPRLARSIQRVERWLEQEPTRCG